VRYLATLAFGTALGCFFLATAQAQSPAVPSSPAQNPSGNMNAALPDGSTQSGLKLEVPDGFGGLKDLPDAAKTDPDPSTGSVVITPTDPQIIMPPKETDGQEP
jgi:hypothetical protein